MKYIFKSNKQQKAHVSRVAIKMLDDGFPDTFVDEAMRLGMMYEEVHDLFVLWEEETDEFEKAELATCIQEAVDDWTE